MRHVTSVRTEQLTGSVQKLVALCPVGLPGLGPACQGVKSGSRGLVPLGNLGFYFGIYLQAHTCKAKAQPKGRERDEFLLLCL